MIVGLSSGCRGKTSHLRRSSGLFSCLDSVCGNCFNAMSRARPLFLLLCVLYGTAMALTSTPPLCGCPVSGPLKNWIITGSSGTALALRWSWSLTTNDASYGHRKSAGLSGILPVRGTMGSGLVRIVTITITAMPVMGKKRKRRVEKGFYDSVPNMNMKEKAGPPAVDHDWDVMMLGGITILIFVVIILCCVMGWWRERKRGSARTVPTINVATFKRNGRSPTPDGRAVSRWSAFVKMMEHREQLDRKCRAVKYIWTKWETMSLRTRNHKWHFMRKELQQKTHSGLEVISAKRSPQPSQSLLRSRWVDVPKYQKGE